MCRINWSMQDAELPWFSTVTPGQNGTNGGIITVALEAFCFMTFSGFVIGVVWQKEESPEVNFH